MISITVIKVSLLVINVAIVVYLCRALQQRRNAV